MSLPNQEDRKDEYNLDQDVWLILATADAAFRVAVGFVWTRISSYLRRFVGSVLRFLSCLPLGRTHPCRAESGIWQPCFFRRSIKGINDRSCCPAGCGVLHWAHR